MNSSELKKKYLDYFRSKGHKLIPSASLIPENDPTVLFTTAGMHPLVPFLLGQPHPLGRKIANVQKCIRTGDIDEVGDPFHHTFFEMLGNWSFGDYFKEEAISMSFEFLTKCLKLPVTHLAVTCFAGDKDAPKDEESASVWQGLGIRKERIAFLGKKDNWWGPAGATGPCGPDTEMFYWVGKDEPPKTFNPENEKWVEIWNDVFMEYGKYEDGSYKPLKQKNVDTGLGVERVAAIMQGLDDNYLIESFRPLIKRIEKLSGKEYEKNKRMMRIVADHLRASVFILGDERGVVPSNLDQGYILRRFIRRSMRSLKVLGVEINDINLGLIAEEVIKVHHRDYSSLKDKRKFIIDELMKEQDRFRLTLEKGLREFEKMSGDNLISGKEAFLLFQSYGFPLEMTEELAAEKNVKVDSKGFIKEFELHQELSRVGAEKKFKSGLSDASKETKKLHTATHILAEALRRIISPEIKQRGSNITSERLRFDFNLDRKLTPEEIDKVEKEVNRIIKLRLKVKAEEMPLQDALKSGAQAEFGARYPEKVTVYSIGKYSKEICMGPHVDSTGELGHFKIIKEESSASGIRRIKAKVNS